MKKPPRPAALPSVTMMMPTRCGKIYVTVTVDAYGLPFETFVRFGKAGHCGAAIFDATKKLISYALRSGIDPLEAVKALGGIGCHCGTDSCMNAVSLVLREVLEHPWGLLQDRG